MPPPPVRNAQKSLPWYIDSVDCHGKLTCQKNICLLLLLPLLRAHTAGDADLVRVRVEHHAATPRGTARRPLVPPPGIPRPAAASREKNVAEVTSATFLRSTSLYAYSLIAHDRDRSKTVTLNHRDGPPPAAAANSFVTVIGTVTAVINTHTVALHTHWPRAGPGHRDRWRSPVT